MKVMKKRMGQAVALLLGMCAVSLGYTNPIEGGSTETITNQWNISFLELHVGGNTASNSMVIVNGGAVNNQNGVLGNTVASSNNSVMVIGTNAVWNNAGNLTVGHYGGGNSVSVSSGGQVNADNVYIGNHSDGNSVSIDGTGSTLSATTLSVGQLGSGNVLAIGHGGHVDSANATIGYWIGADNNQVSISGRNSLWNNSGTLTVGDYGAGNQLAIENGGRVNDLRGVIGSEMGANHNTVLVTGEGSVWQNDQALYLGGTLSESNRWEEGGSGNSLVVSDYGFVRVGSYATNALHVSFMHPNGVIEVGDALENGVEMILENESRVSNGLGFIGYGSNEMGRVSVRKGSLWQNSENLYVGFYGASNSLTISGGGRVENESGCVGYHAGANANTLLVTGVGSVLTNSMDLYIGRSGVGNELIVEDGGHVDSQYLFIGKARANNSDVPAIFSTNNRVVVSGENSSLNVGLDLIISGRNQMEIRDGAIVESLTGHVGENELYGTTPPEEDTTPFYKMIVTGEGSRWVNGRNIYVGRYDSNNSHLLIEDGGYVMSTKSYIGSIGGSTNSITVSGKGSILTNSLALRVGNAVGGGNSLHVIDGGAVINSQGYIGSFWGSSNSSVQVSGGGSYWQNKESLYMGGYRYSGTNWISCSQGNSLTVADYGVVSVGDSAGNTGWPPPSLSGRIVVGNATGTAELIAANGALINAGELIIGLQSNETGTVTLQEEGTIWHRESLGAPMYVGYAGSSNRLSVLDGAKVESNDDFSSLMIGGNEGSDHNTVLVSGENATLSMKARASFRNPAIFIGNYGAHNRLIIEGGGLVDNGQGFIGRYSSASNNSVVVTGSHSSWTNSSNLSLGGAYERFNIPGTILFYEEWVDGGVNNSLIISDGGQVEVEKNIFNRNVSLVSVDSGSRIDVGGDYYQDASSVLRFGVETNSVGMPTNALVSVGDTATFEAGATLQVASNVGLLEFGRTYTNLIIEADTLVVGSITNANSVELKQLNVESSLVNLMLWEDEQNIYGLFGRKHLWETAGFDPQSQLGRLAEEIDDLSLLGDLNAINQIGLLQQMTGEQQATQLSQLYMRNAPTYQHMQGMLDGMGQVHKRVLETTPMADRPDGAEGPYTEGRGVQGWYKLSGSWGVRDSGGVFSGYDQTIYGHVIGLDKTYENALMGVAGGYAQSSIDQNDMDRSRAKTGYGVLYATWMKQDWIGDLSVSYGRSSVETESGTGFDVKGDFDARSFAGYFGSGREFQLMQRKLRVVPKVSMLLSHYAQDAYKERGTVGASRDVDAYNRTGFLSSVGADFSLQKEIGFMLLKPEVRLHWLHEFNADEDAVGFGLVNGTGRYQFSMSAPVEDLLNAGVGLGVRLHDELDLVLDVDGRFGKDFSAYMVSGRAVYEF